MNLVLQVVEEESAPDEQETMKRLRWWHPIFFSVIHAFVTVQSVAWAVYHGFQVERGDGSSFQAGLFSTAYSILAFPLTHLWAASPYVHKVGPLFGFVVLLLNGFIWWIPIRLLMSAYWGEELTGTKPPMKKT